MNSIEITNTGIPDLSELRVADRYKENWIWKSSEKSQTEPLAQGEQHKWTDVFPGKAMFGGNKITDPEIVSISSAQGDVVVVDLDVC